MGHYRPVRAVLLLLVVVAFTTLHLGGQTLAGVEQGIKPYGSYEGGNVDSVNMVNGSLTLNIPLVSYSRRGGKLKLAFRLVYDNPWLQPFATACDEYTKICRTTGYNLAYIANPSNCGGNTSAMTCGTATGVVPDFGLVIGVVLNLEKGAKTTQEYLDYLDRKQQ